MALVICSLHRECGVLRRLEGRTICFHGKPHSWVPHCNEVCHYPHVHELAEDTKVACAPIRED